MVERASFVKRSGRDTTEGDNGWQRWLRLLPLLNEAQCRLYVAEKALALGRGGISEVARRTGISRPTITKGIEELETEINAEGAIGIRQAGGGRKRVEVTDKTLLSDLDRIMAESTAGDPMSRLKWTGKSLRKLAEQLTRVGHAVNPNTVGRLLKSMDYSLRGNFRSLEGKQHPNRDAQFRYINRQVNAFIKAADPVISVDTKKKELVGNFENAGRTWCREATKVNAYDFASQATGKAIPYGIYDLQNNSGLVNIGTTHDTAEFAVESISRWWKSLGRRHYSHARRLLICADGGGSNASRSHLWKLALQQFANTYGLEVTVLHYPPGTSKWNKIEHQMFSYISIHWRGRPLVSYETVINLISSTTTKSGLKIRVALDPRTYEKGIKVTKKQLASLSLRPHKKHPTWNYTLRPNT